MGCWIWKCVESKPPLNSNIYIIISFCHKIWSDLLCFPSFLLSFFGSSCLIFQYYPVRVILKDFGRERQKWAVPFDTRKDLKTNNERIMNNISTQMNEKVTFLMVSGHIAHHKWTDIRTVTSPIHRLHIKHQTLATSQLHYKSKYYVLCSNTRNFLLIVMFCSHFTTEKSEWRKKSDGECLCTSGPIQVSMSSLLLSKKTQLALKTAMQCKILNSKYEWISRNK